MVTTRIGEYYNFTFEVRHLDVARAVMLHSPPKFIELFQYLVDVFVSRSRAFWHLLSLSLGLDAPSGLDRCSCRDAFVSPGYPLTRH